MTGQPSDDFESYRADLEAAERRVAGEIQPGVRALVVAILVFVLLGSFLLPHSGGARGFDVLVGNDKAVAVGITVQSRIFTWFALVFGVGFSMLSLLTRRWVLAWITLAGSALACGTGMLAVWSRQTVLHGHPGPGIGLILGWLTVIVLTFHWARVVWTRTAVQLAAEDVRRREAAERQSQSFMNSTVDDVEHRSTADDVDQRSTVDEVDLRSTADEVDQRSTADDVDDRSEAGKADGGKAAGAS